MKTILIATDFSAASRDATEYGLRLAEALEATPVLFSAWQEVPILMPDSLMTFVPLDNRRTVMTQLAGEARLFGKGNARPLRTLLKEGPIVPAILEAAKETEAGLIIAGMKAGGHATRKLFGSTVTTLARKTSVPLLVVPETAVFTPIHVIALAEDVRWDDGRPTPQLLMRLLQEFHCRLLLLRVYSRQSGEVIEILHQDPAGGHMIGSFNPLREIPTNGRIVDALANFVSHNPVDILVMRPHPTHAPERWFLGSHTLDMLFASNIPLLVLPLAAELTTMPAVSTAK